MTEHIKRREVITLLGSVAAVWPLDARAQRPAPMRRIGILLPGAADDAEYQARLAAFQQELEQFNWSIGRNLRMELRWGGGNVDSIRKHADELAALAPEVILAHGAAAVAAMQRASRTIPIVFPLVADPVGAGFVDSLARPGGNITGFMAFEYSLSGKWLELLKQIAPSVTRVAVLRDPALPSAIGQFGVIQALASSIRVEVYPINLRDAAEIQRAITAFAQAPNGGMIATGVTGVNLHRKLIIALAAHHKLPAVYPYRYFVTDGGLICYGPDLIGQYRQAAGYVDRILKGEKPADLPVQAPTKYETVLNLKTARALGLDVPAGVLVRADEVIE